LHKETTDVNTACRDCLSKSTDGASYSFGGILLSFKVFIINFGELVSYFHFAALFYFTAVD